MATGSLEDRVRALENEMALLKARLEPMKRTSADWLDKIYGSFANDPIYEEAMRLGREYRESQRPKPKRRRKR
jgi:hypothetical protein